MSAAVMSSTRPGAATTTQRPGAATTTPRWRRLAADPRVHRWLGRVAPALSARLARRLTMWPLPAPPRDGELAALAGAQSVVFRSGTRALRWGAEGPVVLAMHGWEGRPGQFANLLPGLLAAGRQVIAPYGPAHEPDARGDANVLQFARVLRDVAAELGEVEGIVGHSMGGAAALLAVRDGLAVRRVATLAAPSALARSLRRTARALALPGPAYRAFRRLVDARLGVPARRVDVAPHVRGLATPVLVVHDRDDRSVPFAEAERLVAALPGATLLATRALRHVGILHDAAVVDAVVDFLVARAE